jgi:putative sigma-54 modulation protein
MTNTINFTFKHIDSTDAIKSHATKKFEKVTRLVPNAFDIQFIFEVDKLEHKAELIFHTNHGQFVSHDISENLYQSIDGAIDKMIHQLSKDKGKHQNHKH